MKMYLAALSTTALISAAPYALAASSVNLTVKGTITPVACTPSLSNEGKIDIGKYSSSDLNLEEATEVGRNPLQLTVACDGKILFALNAIDNQKGTTYSATGFGVGLTPNNEKLGAVFPKILSVVADGQVVGSIESSDSGANWVATEWIKPDTLLAVSATGLTTPIEAQELSMDLEIWTYIAPAETLTLTDEIPLDGHATFEMKYL